MKKIALTSASVFFISFVSFGAPPDKTALGGSWTDANNWSPTGVPGDNQTILIPVGVTLTNYGEYIEMDNSILVIRGTLSMESSCELCADYGQMVFTGPNGGVIIQNGGIVSDDTGILGGSFEYIQAGEPAEKSWSGAPCVLDCGTETGTYTSTGETAWPSSLQNPLPVEFLFFEAAYENTAVLLEWATLVEINNHVFSIERSGDGVAFAEIGQVSGHGNSKERIDYQYTDETASRDFSGKVYYRLKQIDYDGRHEHSEITMVFIKALGVELKNIRPNPFVSQLSLSLMGTQNEEIKVSIYDMDGKNIFAQTTTIDKGHNVIHVDYLDRIPEGIYCVNITGAEFNFRERIVK
ncbi:MAG: T9SS type A sorting domain-containing protein [Cyclobacteriaceae bacterium]